MLTGHCRRIIGFSDKAGWMDRTDPFVQITLGGHTASTFVKNNAGGTAEFNEVLSVNRTRQDSLLQVLCVHLYQPSSLSMHDLFLYMTTSVN